MQTTQYDVKVGGAGNCKNSRMASPVEEGEPIAELPRLVSGSVVSVAEKDGTGRPRFTFEMNLGWSDGTESIIFRGYQEFFDFHCQLLDSFPEDAGNIKGSERVIPFLPGKQVFRRSTRNLALQRLPKLHEYLQEILKLPDHILSSVVLLAFMRDDWEEEKMHYFPPPKNETSSEFNYSLPMISRVPLISHTVPMTSYCTYSQLLLMLIMLLSDCVFFMQFYKLLLNSH